LFSSALFSWRVIINYAYTLFKTQILGFKTRFSSKKKTNCRLDRIIDPGNWDQHIIVEDVSNLKDHLKVKDITTKCVFLIANKVNL